MTRNIVPILALLLLTTACFQNRQPPPEPTDNPHILQYGGYIPFTGKVIDPDSVAMLRWRPGISTYVKASQLDYIPGKTNYYPAEEPQYVPAKGKKINMDTVVQPKYIKSTGNKLPARWPKWTEGQIVDRNPQYSSFSFIGGDQLKSADCMAILEGRDGKIWIGKAAVGLSVWDGQAFINFTEKENLLSNLAWRMLEDRKGRIWICSFEGLSVWDGQGFTHFTEKEGLVSRYTRSLLEDNNGHIWIGTTEGISVWDGEGFFHYSDAEGLNRKDAQSLFEDSQNRVWVSIAQAGVTLWKDSTFIQFNSTEGLANKMVQRITEDQLGRIWFETNTGISIWDGQGFHLYNHPESFARGWKPRLINAGAGNMLIDSINGFDPGIS